MKPGKKITVLAVMVSCMLFSACGQNGEKRIPETSGQPPVSPAAAQVKKETPSNTPIKETPVSAVSTPEADKPGETGAVWSNLEDMPTARLECGVVPVNGKIYVIGGGGGNPWVDVNQLEEYDPAKNKWTQRAVMPVNGSRAAVWDGKIYVVGGSDLYEYDPAGDKWTKKAAVPGTRTQFTLAAANGKIFMIGGKGAEGTMVEEYDIKTGQWISKNDKAIPRRNACAVTVKGNIYLIGGHSFNGRSAVNTVEEYNPETDTWVEKEGMSTPRTDFAAAEVNGIIYAVGGWNAGSIVNSTEEYDIADKKWTTKEPMPYLRSLHGAAAVDGKVYVAGGTMDYKNTLRKFLVYDPALDESAN